MVDGARGPSSNATETKSEPEGGFHPWRREGLTGRGIIIDFTSRRAEQHTEGNVTSKSKQASSEKQRQLYP